MAKEGKPIISDESVEKVIDMAVKMQEASLNHEKVSITMKQGNLKNEKERVVKEFNRVCDVLEMTDPTSRDYYQIAENLNRLKYILDFWYD